MEMVFLIGALLGFFIGGFAARFEDRNKQAEASASNYQASFKARPTPEQANVNARQLADAYRRIEQREHHVDYVLSRYAADRVLQELQRENELGDQVWLAVGLARALDSGIAEPNFPWTEPAHELLYSWEEDGSGRGPLSAGQLMEVSRRAETLVASLTYVPRPAAKELVKFMTLRPDETPEQATSRFRKEGGAMVARTLHQELRARLRSYAYDVFSYPKNEG